MACWPEARGVLEHGRGVFGLAILFGVLAFLDVTKIIAVPSAGTGFNIGAIETLASAQGSMVAAVCPVIALELSRLQLPGRAGRIVRRRASTK
jgi:hypothetical protein